MLRSVIFLLLIFFLWLPDAFASQVTKIAKNRKAVAVSLDAKPFRSDDYVCIEQYGTRLVCGTVVKVTKTVAVVRLDAANNSMTVGDDVRLSRNRRPSSKSEASFRGKKSGDSKFNVGVGLAAGTNYFFPMLQLQYALSKNWVIGVRGLYFSSSDAGASVSAIAGMLSADYYTEALFSGLWLGVAGGIYSFSVNTDSGLGVTISEGKSSPAFNAVVGYAFRHPTGFTASLAGGLQYITDPKFATVDIKPVGAQPLILFSAGWMF